MTLLTVSCCGAMSQVDNKVDLYNGSAQVSARHPALPSYVWQLYVLYIRDIIFRPQFFLYFLHSTFIADYDEIGCVQRLS